MKNNFPSVDKTLLAVVVFFLFLPLLQSTLHFKKDDAPLQGAYVEAPDTTFTWKTWFNGRYQNKKEEHFNQNFGFRNYYVRLNNQFDYTLFQKINTKHVLLGKAGIFYEDDYINAYYGRNFQGTQKLDTLVKKLTLAQQILKSNNIQLEILFLPGKASFYPEYIPDGMRSAKVINNYEYLSASARKAGLGFIDFNAWFRKLKPTSMYDLYPPGGIHWSNYGALMAFDSLRRHIEHNSLLTLRQFSVTAVDFSDELQSPDNDIADALNLWKNPKPLSMPYAKYVWLEKMNETKPRALFIGDSYFWNWYYQGLVNNTFSDARFWYYNQTVYPDTVKVREVKALPFKEEVSKYEVVVLMATETNIHDIGWGFADQVLRNFSYNQNVAPTLSLSNAALTERRRIYMTYFKEEISKTPEWLDKVRTKAKEKGITVEAMLELDAAYLYDTHYSAPAVVEFTESTKKRIREDAKWMKDVTRKAREKNLPVEEMLELDAKYIFEMEGKKKK